MIDFQNTHPAALNTHVPWVYSRGKVCKRKNDHDRKRRGIQIKKRERACLLPHLAALPVENRCVKVKNLLKILGNFELRTRQRLREEKRWGGKRRNGEKRTICREIEFAEYIKYISVVGDFVMFLRTYQRKVSYQYNISYIYAPPSIDSQVSLKRVKNRGGGRKDN